MKDATNNREIIALALGSNLGDRLGSLRSTVSALRHVVKIEKISPVYETPAAYITDQPAFLNAALLATTDLEPLELLAQLKNLETRMGRKETFRYGPRLIDIDLIFYGARQMNTAELTLPHPSLVEREFVLRPLADIIGGWQHPETGVSVERMLQDLPEKSALRLSESL